MEFSGRTVLVTGGSSGIGLAAARLFAGRGAKVVCADLAARESRQRGIGFVRCDVMDEVSVAEAVAHASRVYGRLDILVAVTGVQGHSSAAETNAMSWEEVIAVNIRGALFATRYALPALRASGSGSIVLVSSARSFVTGTGLAADAAGREALIALARSIAVDEARYGVRANTVCAGAVENPTPSVVAADVTDNASVANVANVANGTAAASLDTVQGHGHPLLRAARPTEVAEAIAFLASHRAGFITGATLPVDGGLLARAAFALPD